MELILFAGTCVLVAFGIRAWRRRERAAFHQVDAQVLSDLRQKAGVRADEVVPMEISPGLSSATDPVGAKTSAVPSPVSYETRQQVLDDVRRAFLSTLQPLLAKRGRTGVLVQVPLGTLVRSDDPQDRALRTHVAFVMYQLKDFAPLCVVEIKGSGAQEAARLSQLRNVLGTAGLPLVEFPMLDRYGRSELITELRAYL